MYLAAMADLAARLNTGAVLATTDPVKAAHNRPCLLVVPPAVDYAAGTFAGPELQHRVIALAGGGKWDLDAAEDLDTLLVHVEDLLPELQRAEPTLYAITEAQRVPAYVLTLSTL